MRIHLTALLLVCQGTALGNELDRADEVSFDFAILGGSANPSVVQGASLSTGTAELAMDWHSTTGMTLGLVGQSQDFETLRRDEETRRFTGGAVGLRVGYQWRRLSVFGDALLGSVREDGTTTTSRASRGSGSQSTLGLGGGVGFSLWQTERVDLKLVAAADRLGLSGRSDDALGTQLVRQQLGLRLSYFPDTSRRTRSHVAGSFGCYGCGQAGYYGGRALVQGGSLLGRAVSTGLFRALLGFR